MTSQVIRKPLPIMFSGPMVRALLEGRKTQTRRILKPQPPTPEAFPGSDFGLSPAVADGVKMYSLNDYERLPKHPTKWDLVGSVGVARNAGAPMVYNARFAKGDVLWVRETWQGLTFGDYQPTARPPCDLRYKATDPLAACAADVRGYQWRPAIHMPRWASRLALAVRDVRVERLQAIKGDDAIAEGVEFETADPPFYYVPHIDTARTAVGVEESGGRHAERSFSKLWDVVNGPGAWDRNPWVVALTFTVHKRNVDELLQKRSAA